MTSALANGIFSPSETQTLNASIITAAPCSRQTLSIWLRVETELYGSPLAIPLRNCCARGRDCFLPHSMAAMALIYLRRNFKRINGSDSRTDGRVWFWAVDELRYWDRGRWSEPVRIPDVVKDYPAPQNTSSRTEQSGEQQIQKSDRTRYGIIAGIQDQKGYLWLATHRGIITYDPRTGKLQKYPDLKDERAHSIYEDHQGRIWFNEIFEAVVYNRSNGTIKRHAPLDHIGRMQDAPHENSLINGICQDRRGRMLFVFTEGLSIFDEIENRWSFSPSKALGLDVEETVNHLNSIMEDSQGRIWLPGFTGIAILDQFGPATLENRGRVPRNLRLR